MADDLRTRFIELLSTRLPCLRCGRTTVCRCARPKDAPSDAERRADQLLAERDDDLRAAETVIDDLAALVRDLAYTDPCEHDHHGHCQAHGWTDDDRPCPHARARDVLAAQEAGGGRG